MLSVSTLMYNRQARAKYLHSETRQYPAPISFYVREMDDDAL
jgi:hypothetical protein